MSYFVYLIIKEHIGNEALGFFVGTASVAVASEILAVMMKNPATVFLLSGLLPLVPGGGLFYMMRALVQEEFAQAFAIGYQTMMAAASIALGVAVVSSVFRIVQAFLRRKRSRRVL